MHAVILFAVLVVAVHHAEVAVGSGAGHGKGRLQGTRAVALLSTSKEQAEPTTEPPAEAVRNRTEVSEDNYKPPVPLPEKHQSAIHRTQNCCPEPHCCGVEQMVVESKEVGPNISDLLKSAKSLKAAAVLGGEQAEYARNASERRLRSSHKDEEAAVTLALAQAEAESRAAQAVRDDKKLCNMLRSASVHYCNTQEVTALAHELGEVEKVNAKLEKDEAEFNEELIKSKEDEVEAAEVELNNLKAQRHNIAEAIQRDVKLAQEEEQQADLEAKLAELHEGSSSSETAEEAIKNKLEALEQESRTAEGEAAQQELREKVSEIRARTDETVKRGRNTLKEADETTKAFPTQHPNIAAAEQASLDSIHETETAAAVAQHDVEAEEELFPQESGNAAAPTESTPEPEEAREEGEFPSLRSTASARYGRHGEQVRCFPPAEYLPQPSYPPHVQTVRHSAANATLADPTVHQNIKPHAGSTWCSRLLS